MTSAFEAASSPAESERLFGIAELADEFGITARAIRFYEAKGLLTPPRVNHGRVYTKRDRARLKLILRAKSIGFTLAEIKQFLSLYGERGEGRPQQMAFVAARSATLVKELEQKQAAIAATIEELKDIHRQCLLYLAEKAPCQEEEPAPARKGRRSRSED